MQTSLKFCTTCAAPLTLGVPPGDSHPRHHCPCCGTVHYVNPRVVVACVAEYRGRILLCQRKIEPRQGFWTLPAGFLEVGETTAEAAIRETYEEAGVRVSIDGFYFLCESSSEVYVVYRGRARSGRTSPGAESMAVGWFREDDVPWESLSFPLVGQVLRRYFQDSMERAALGLRFDDSYSPCETAGPWVQTTPRLHASLAPRFAEDDNFM